MRPLKFRQPILTKDGFERWHYWGFTERGMFSGPMPPLDRESYQFTGLLDRHRKEIWEGDRVTAHYFYFDGNFDADGYITGEIRITPNGILICSDTEDRFIYETSHHDEPCLEVIGNIFEGEKK